MSTPGLQSTLTFVAACLLLATHPLVMADEIEFGVASSCDQARPRFQLAGVVEHNRQFTTVASSLTGLRQLTYGATKLRCRLGSTLVKATVHVNPASNGECMGAGYVVLSDVDIGGHRLSIPAEGEPFNWKCVEGQMMVRLTFLGSGLRLQLNGVPRTIGLGSPDTHHFDATPNTFRQTKAAEA